MQGIIVNCTIKGECDQSGLFPNSEQPAKRKSVYYQRYQKRHSLISDRYYMYSEKVATIWLLELPHIAINFYG